MKCLACGARFLSADGHRCPVQSYDCQVRLDDDRADLVRRANELPGLTAMLDELNWEHGLLLKVAEEARKLFEVMNSGCYIPYSATDALRAALLVWERRLSIGQGATVADRTADSPCLDCGDPWSRHGPYQKGHAYNGPAAFEKGSEK